ncbi:MAG: hypothetical protein AB8B79_18840 [Granulosicoccus sp.]
MKTTLWQQEHKELEAQLLRAHKLSESSLLANLYTRSADLAEQNNDVDAACFYLTQALIYALEAGLADDEMLVKRLSLYGRI